VGARYTEDTTLRRFVWFYLAVWAVAAVRPLDRETWLLENLLVFVLVAVLVATHWHFAFSKVSYGLIVAFLVLHAIGAHYTYSMVPIGFAVQDLMGLERNHYDRVAHFGFGLLLAYPLRELLIRIVHVHRIWGYVAPPVAVLSLGSLYEIMESWAARIAAPELGVAYLGTQGDVWDGQKDMTLAFTGSVVAMGLTALWRWRSGHEPYLYRSRTAQARTNQE
jgi:putative membrane protein